MARRPSGKSKAAKPPPSRRRGAQSGDRPSETPPDKSDPILAGVNPAVDDHLTPKESLPFPIVAIGASAGGLEAFTVLLHALPTDTGMAFVVIQHLSPTHESMLPEILTRATSMPVAQVLDDTPVQPDHVYVIPPGKNLVFADGELRLSPRTEIRGVQRPIDHFMRALAEEHGHKAIGVVLSGTANDGSLGIQEIKAGGGITFAQDTSAEQQSMPRSAVATGAIDFVLPPDEIARELGRIARHPYVSPALDAGAIALNESSMQRILGILRHATGVDFDGYKRNTINRRIARRMVLHKLDGLHDYVRYLQANANEVEALFQDVLINVTSFFRNPEAYEALKTTVFPKLTEDRSRHEPVRIWALGCSTGEEAYSLAMTFTEYIEQAGRTADAQIFATDLNGNGIDRARGGIYAKGITQDVSADRLRRFFVEVDGSYRITKKIRDMCVFARQNVLADPPFSRLDLVACRNLLIYLEPVQQQRLIPMLHYSLRNNGYLWLGGSETIGSYRELFDILDTKHKIYAKKPVVNQGYVPPAGHRWEPHRAAGGQVMVPVREPQGLDSQREAERLLLSRYAPPSVVLNDELEIIQFRGDTGPYLTPAPGRATHNLLKMLREGLMVGVRSALQKARKESTIVRTKELRVRSNGGWRDVDIEVLPLKSRTSDTGAAYVVVFEEPARAVLSRARQIHDDAVAEAARAGAKSAKDSSKEAVRLAQELAATREYLQSVIEQQEAANEELQSANEEVQSANEELQSINEELETSKEEIQSANEELATVNDELQNRNHELSQSNNDLTNLFASVQLAIVMLGPDLRIRRFTPAAEKILNLIPSDIGRPLSDINLNVPGEALEDVVNEVVDRIEIREREVQDRHGRWYSMRVRPYRTLENVIDGAVLVMVDIDELKRADQALRESEARFEVLANTAPVLIWMSDLEGCRFVNRAFEDFVGELEPDIRGSSISRFVHPDDRDTFETAFSNAVKSREAFQARTRFRRADGEYRWTKTVGQPRFHAGGQLVGFVGGTFDITDMKEAEAALLELDRGKNEFLAMLAHELRNPLSGVRNASRLLSDAHNETVVGQAREIIDRQTTHMVRMIDDLLDVSRITQGKIHLRFEPVDLVAVLKECIESGAEERRKLDQALTVSLPQAPVWVEGDAMRLDQIVSNLLGNASKFTRPGGKIWLTLGVEEAKGDRGASAVIRVRDNGAGIEPSLLPRIFDLFVQSDQVGDSTRTRTGIGIGLGLTLAKRLVELHEGSIEVFSAGSGMGSEFIVRLPLTVAPAAKPQRESRKKTAQAQEVFAAAAAKGKGAVRVLIVDDNADSAHSMRMLLEQAGHEVQVVSDGDGVAARALQFRPRAILLDIGLPDKDGYTVARELRKERALDDVLIIAVTGYGGDDHKTRSRDAGIDEHMTKPVDVDALLECIGAGRAGTRA